MEFRLKVEELIAEVELTEEERDKLAGVTSNDFLSQAGFQRHGDDSLYVQALQKIEEKGLLDQLQQLVNSARGGYFTDPMLDKDETRAY